MNDVAAGVISAVAWPVTILVLALLFRGPLVDLVGRLRKASVAPKGIEVILDALERRGEVPFGAIAELRGLTSHDIWALWSFATAKTTPVIATMNTPQRVAARTLVDAGLLKIEGDAADRRVVPSQLGDELLRAAEELI